MNYHFSLSPKGAFSTIPISTLVLGFISPFATAYFAYTFGKIFIPLILQFLAYLPDLNYSELLSGNMEMIRWLTYSVFYIAFMAAVIIGFVWCTVRSIKTLLTIHLSNSEKGAKNAGVVDGLHYGDTSVTFSKHQMQINRDHYSGKFEREAIKKIYKKSSIIFVEFTSGTKVSLGTPVDHQSLDDIENEIRLFLSGSET